MSEPCLRKENEGFSSAMKQNNESNVKLDHSSQLPGKQIIAVQFLVPGAVHCSSALCLFQILFVDMPWMH